MGQRAVDDARGFTLLELAVTLFILGLAGAIAAPAIGRNIETLEARAKVRAFSAVLRHAREQAITTQRAHAVVVDPIARRVSVVAEEQVRTTRAFSPRVMIVANPPEAVTVRFEPQGYSSGGDFRVTAGGAVYRVTIDALTGRVRSARE